MPGETGGPNGSSNGGAGNTAMTRTSHEQFFPIATGPHAMADCNSCHGGFSSFKEFTCVSCHDHEQTKTDAAHVGIKDYKYDSASCLSCHPQGVAGEVSRTDHAQYFPIDVGTPHATSQCTDCHQDPADKKQFTCVSCHDHEQGKTDTGHKGIADYKYESASCLSCHPQGIAAEISRADHTKYFPIDVGTPHETGMCADCHQTSGDRSQFTCISCHEHEQTMTNTAHQGIADYKYESPACLSCHPQGVAGEIARPDHTQYFPIDVGTPHANAQCAECHTTPGDRTQFSCTDCHDHEKTKTDTGHLGIPNYKYDSPSCISCHPQGLTIEFARADHAKFFPITTGTTHGVFQCADCHMTPGDRSQFNCIACHDHEKTKTDGQHTMVATYKYDSPSCYSCHKDGKAMFDHATLPTPPNCIGCHKADLDNANVTPSSRHVDNKFPTTCESCHKSFTSWGPGTAMNHTIVGGTGSKCETCHIDDFSGAAKTPFDHAAQKVSANTCNMCHTDFTTWLKFNHSSNCFNGSSLRGHQGATCTQCHTDSSDYSKSSCTACHSNRGTNCND